MIEMKENLDSDILDLIKNFETMTGLFVRWINVDSTAVLGGRNETIRVRTEVEL